MKVGASYYPELSNWTIWTKDLATARDLGLRVMRCGEFAWGKFSPEPDQWNDAWALEFLDLAQEHGIEVVWCTPTAIPPHYLFDRWPELAARNWEGLYMPRGVRRHYCPSHEGYLALAEEVAGKLVRSLDQHPAIVGWQIDNELAGDGFTCWCPRCEKVFQRWLENKYGNLETLNKTWQTNLWSQRFTDWSQIPIPQAAFSISHTPALKLAWRQFRSSNWLAFYRRQADALHAAGAKHPVTTNFYNLEWDIPFDRWAWRPYLDVVGLSHYTEEETASRFDLALLRGWGEKALWVLEQKAGQQNAQNLYPESLDRIETHLRRCLDAGVEYATYWHFRQHQVGCEMEHGAVVRHDGKPTRVARAIQQAIKNIASAKPEPLRESHALVFDFPQRWAQEHRPQPGTPWDYRKVVEQDWFAALRETQGTIVVSSMPDALRKAKVVYAPHFQMADESHISAIGDFARHGGVFITTADFGRLDLCNNVRPQKPLAPFALFGDVPEGEMYQLKSDFKVAGLIGGSPLHGSFFWFVPDVQLGENHLHDADLASPAFLKYPVEAGCVIVLLSAFDRKSLGTLLSRFSSPDKR